MKNNCQKSDQSNERLKMVDKIDFNSIIKKDAKEFNAIYQKVLDRIKDTNGIEKFITSWAFIEQITLPSLIRLIFCRLQLSNIPNMDDMTTSQLISCYYFISHDYNLYKDLVVANKMRNKIVHKVYLGDPDDKMKADLKENTNFILKSIFIPILERLTGKTSIPVLTLYGK